MSAPGKHFRKGISLRKLFQMFPDNATAEAWFVAQRWGGNVTCPKCGFDNVQTGAKHKSMPYRCRVRDCGKRFSVRYGTVMESSKLDYQVWAIAIYLIVTGIKGVSSMKLHRDLNITQKSAWHLAHRLRKCLEADGIKEFVGPVEVDETYIGGKERNKHQSKRLNAGRGAVGKQTVIGIKDRKTDEIVAEIIEETDRPTLLGFILRKVQPNSKVFTDDALAYRGMPLQHQSVKHSVGEYVNGMAHTNGIESFWSMLKRGYHGTYHHMSRQHLFRYVSEFAMRHNIRRYDTTLQLGVIARKMEGQKLRYQDLVQ